MRLLTALPLGLSLLLSVPAHAQSTDPADRAARAALFRSCGGVESATLPTGFRTGVYRGTLGTQPITLEFSESGGAPGGEHPDRYSYDRFGTDIALERGRAANRTAGYALLAVEAVFDGLNETARGCLDLSADGAALKGQWRTPDGRKRLPVALQPVNVSAAPLALPASPGLLKLRSSDPYTFLKLNRAWLKVPGGLKEPSSGVVYPRLAGAPAALNAALQDRQLALVGEALDCRSSYGVNLANGTDYSGVGTLSWKSAGLVSLHKDVDYFCGGAHPDAYTAGVTLSARSGQPVVLAGTPGAVWPGLSAPKLRALYLAGYPRSSGDAECLDAVSRETPGSDDFQLYLTRQGLAVWPSFLPHVVLACAEVVTVPYAALRALADPRSPVFRDLYPR